MKNLLFPALAAVLAAGIPTAGAFVMAERSDVILGVEACKAALPVYDAQLRFRPLAVQNESDRLAFVSCGFDAATGNVPSIDWIGVIMRNDSNASVVANCVFVNARYDADGPEMFTLPVTLPAGSAGVIRYVQRIPAHTYPGISCGLPPGVGVSAVWQRYRESIGD